MPRFLGGINQIAPIFAIAFLLTSRIEAAELPEVEALNSNQQAYSRSQIQNRQVDLKLDKFNSSISQATQANSVEQLKDVRPIDWSYEALRSLIDRYSCVIGFPAQTYRGDQTVSRYEFVAGLNACLNRIESLFANSDDIPQEDIDTLLKLMQEFQTDLALLQGRTDGSQARIEDLQATQFSTTSKLTGEVIFGLGSILTGSENDNSVLGSRTRLDIKTSLNGNDLLFTRLSGGNFTDFSESTATFAENLAFAEPTDNDLGLETLYYTFKVGGKTDFILGATGTGADELANTVNVLDGDGGSGAISAFGTRNPIYYPPGDAGMGIRHRPLNQIEISAGYLASPANQSNSGSGLFNGPFSALGQILFTPNDNLNFAATYIHSYNQSDTKTGSNLANLRSQSTKLFGTEISTVSNSYGVELSWTVSDRIILGGWGTLSTVRNLSNVSGQIDPGTQNIWNWATTLALTDLGKEGSMAGIVVGMEPTVTDSTINNLKEDRDRSLHLEAFYQYQVNDNIAITPGVIWITAPDSNTQNSDDLVIGTVRTTFSF